MSFRWFSIGFRRRMARREFEIPIFEAGGEFAIATRFHPHRAATHTRPNVLGGDLEQLTVMANRIVAGNHAAVDPAETGFQYMVLC